MLAPHADHENAASQRPKPSAARANRARREASDQGGDDAALMDALARGEQSALGPLYARYAPLIFRVAERALGKSGAEEVVQEVFLVVWRQAGAFDRERGEFRHWLTQIARFRIANELRRRQRHPGDV